MVTERTFCDFVLYAKNGPVSIERIYRDEPIVADILRTLSGFWKSNSTRNIWNVHPKESSILCDAKWIFVTILWQH